MEIGDEVLVIQHNKIYNTVSQEHHIGKTGKISSFQYKSHENDIDRIWVILNEGGFICCIAEELMLTTNIDSILSTLEDLEKRL